MEYPSKAVITTMTCMLLSLFSFSNHISGAFIEYKCIESGLYEVTLNVFQDCADDLVTDSQIVRVIPDCNFNFFSVPLPLISVEAITEVCSNVEGNTLCEEGGVLNSFRLARYRNTFEIDTECESFRVMWKVNYRTDSDNTEMDNWVFYTHSIIYPNESNCSTGPEITAPDIPFRCIGSEVSFDFGATDMDDDSLAYELAPVLHSPSGNQFAPITYLSGYDFMTPVAGAVLDSETGAFSYSPSFQGRYALVIKVSEFADDGTLLSEIYVDFLLQNILCQNEGLVNVGEAENIEFSPGVSEVAPLVFEVCQGQSFCGSFTYPVVGEDLEFSLSDNLSEGFMNAETSWTQEEEVVTIEFCATSPDELGEHQVSFQLSDGVCPYPRTTTTTLIISVTDDVAPLVVIEDFGSELALIDPQAGYSYQWYLNGSPILGETASTLQVDPLPGEEYQLLVMTLNGCSTFSNTVGMPIGLMETTSIPVFRLVPNPVEDAFILFIDDSMEGQVLSLSILGTDGRFIKEMKLSGLQESVDVSHLSAGHYLLRLVREEGVHCSSFIKL